MFFDGLSNVLVIIYKTCFHSVVLSIIQANNVGKEKLTPSDLMDFDGFILRVALPTVIRKHGGDWRLAEKQYSRKTRVPEGIFDFIFNMISQQNLNTVKANELMLVGSHFSDIYFKVWSTVYIPRFIPQFICIRIDIEIGHTMTTHKGYNSMEFPVCFSSIDFYIFYFFVYMV